MKLITIIVIFIIMMLVGCKTDKTIFMGRHNVASGHYFLTMETKNGLLMMSDPQLLEKYRQQVRVQPATKENHCDNPLKAVAMNILCLIPVYNGDRSLKLMHRNKGLIRELRHGQTYTLPTELYNSGKIIAATEQWKFVDLFLQRKQALQQIEGVTITHADTPPYPFLVNIYFPLRVELLKDDFELRAFQDEFSRNIEAALRERFIKEMESQGIADYQIIHTLHQGINQQVGYDITDRRVTTDRPIIPLHPSYQTHNYFYLEDYRADLFAMQINCDQAGVQYIQSIQNQLWDWLPSLVSHDDFIAKLKLIVEQKGVAFNPELTIDTLRLSALTTDFSDPATQAYPINYLSGEIHIGKRRMDQAESLKLSWQYDIQRALDYPYPPALTQGMP